MKFLALYNAYATRTTALLAALCLVSVFAYGTLLLMAVAHAASLAQIQDESVAIEGRVSTLQARYLAETKNLTLERAYALGYVEPVAETSVAADDVALSILPEELR